MHALRHLIGVEIYCVKNSQTGLPIKTTMPPVTRALPETTLRPTTATLPRWSVRTVLIWLVIACLFPGVIATAFLFISEYRKGRSEQEQATIQTSRALMQAIDSHLLRVQAVAETLATSDTLSRRDFARFHRQAREALARSELGTTAVLWDETGKQVLNTAVPWGRPLPAAAAPEQVRIVFASGEASISNIFRDSSRRPIASIDVPVTLDGKVVYALEVDILSHHFNALLKAQNLPSNWIAAVLDSTGTIAGRTHSPEQFVGKKAAPILRRSLEETREGSIEATTVDGVEVVSFYSRSPITNWSVAIGIPREAVLSGLFRPLSLLAAGVVVLFGIGLLLAWFIGGRIARSVQALITPAMALSRSSPAALPRVDIKEVEEVAAAIGRAADLIKAKDTDLAEAHLLARLGTWSWNMKTGEVTASASLSAICGRDVPPFEEQRGTLLTVESWERINAAAREAIQTGKGYDMEIQVNHGSGETVWMNAKCEAVRNEKGEVVILRGMLQDLSERKLAERRIRNAALHDVVTGLPNRVLVLEYCERLLAAAQRNHGRGALLYIDLDRFKSINDIYGHETGDRVLQEVGKRLAGCTRHEDLTGRLGGDEFVIVLAHLEAGRHSAAVVAQHVLDSLSRPYRIDALEFSVSTSIGISCFPEHASDVNALIRTADLALYLAKRAGRGNYQFYMPELDRRIEEAFSIEARIRQALREGGLELHYQPVIDIKSGKLIGAEALVRLMDNDGNALRPDRFIPVAEASGLIAELGEWVAAEACRQHEVWFGQGLKLTIAINVSPLQFRQRNFAEKLRSIISESRIDPSYLEIEVTESAIMENIGDAVEILNRIKSLGVKVALDDFGTGYSSLSSLTSLPLDKLKVDQSFVRRIDQDQASRSVTETILSLGRSLKLHVHAEGIDSDTALRYLRLHGCNHAQGYWFSPPLPAARFVQWYREEWSQGHVQARWRRAAGRPRG